MRLNYIKHALRTLILIGNYQKIDFLFINTFNKLLNLMERFNTGAHLDTLKEFIMILEKNKKKMMIIHIQY